MSDSSVMGRGWRLSTDHHGTTILVVPMAMRGCKRSEVRVPIPADLVRRITGEPEVKILPVSVDSEAMELKPHWLRLLALVRASGCHQKLTAKPLASILGSVTHPQMRGAAMALWKRGYLSRVSARGGSHYWVTVKGQRLLNSAQK